MNDQPGKSLRTAYVVASQGHRRQFLQDYDFQPWVNNINKLLWTGGFRTTVLGAGDHTGSYISDARSLRIILRQKTRLLDDYFSLSLAWSMLVARKPALVVIHGLQHLLTLTALIAFGLLKRVAILQIVHGVYEDPKPLSRLRDTAIQLVLKVLTKTNLPCVLLSLTRYDKNHLLQRWGISKDSIIVSPFPLYIRSEEQAALAQTQTASHEGKDEGDPFTTFLFVGRLSPNKQVDHVIRALHELQNQGYSARLVIVGDGPSKAQLATLIDALDMGSQITLIGAVSNWDKWQFYASSDVLILASKREGLPRVIFEAFVAGKPVVVPDICGIREIVHNNLHGIIFQTFRELVDALITLIEKPSFAQAVGQTNRARVRTELVLETKGYAAFTNILERLDVPLPNPPT